MLTPQLCGFSPAIKMIYTCTLCTCIVTTNLNDILSSLHLFPNIFISGIELFNYCFLTCENHLESITNDPHSFRISHALNGIVYIFSFQFWLVMKYLSEMTEDQTLVMCSGHPQGLFPSSPSAPRLIITNGLLIMFFFN